MALFHSSEVLFYSLLCRLVPHWPSSIHVALSLLSVSMPHCCEPATWSLHSYSIQNRYAIRQAILTSWASRSSNTLCQFTFLNFSTEFLVTPFCPIKSVAFVKTNVHLLFIIPAWLTGSSLTLLSTLSLSIQFLSQFAIGLPIEHFRFLLTFVNFQN